MVTYQDLRDVEIYLIGSMNAMRGEMYIKSFENLQNALSCLQKPMNELKKSEREAYNKVYNNFMSEKERGKS